MDALRVTKVEGVECTKLGKTNKGTIHLTAHHVIFRYDDTSLKELWLPYPHIAFATRLAQSLDGRAPLTLDTWTFESYSLTFPNDKESLDVFDTIKELTILPSVNKLYAFNYSPNPKFPNSDGWNIYSPREEFGRMGLGTRSKSWRFTDINKDYSFCSTYPSRLVIPTRISDTTLQYASKYRSKSRIPALTYLHWANFGSITRSSQPMVGVMQARSIQDETLIKAIFQSHHSPDSRTSHTPVYGATTTNLIIDARPTTNAVANTAKGAGTENMDHYKEGKKAYLGIDNIHTMRDSIIKVMEALKEAEKSLTAINSDLAENMSALATLDRQLLRKSGWLRHISAILEGSVLIAKNIHVNSSHVLIHCSDGWDRTAQLSSISQLCLDPFYRTIRGFEILIEKDWVSFGHKFTDRCGHLSSERNFISQSENAGGGGGAEAAQAFFASVQNRFAGNSHFKESSPVFHQFLECVRQIQRQFPNRFEFNERFLRQLYYHAYSCQFGTFLFNTEQERRVGEGSSQTPYIKTLSAWDFFNSPEEMALNRNPDYDRALDDPSQREAGADMGVLFPNPKDVRFWNELYGRTDEEMNGRIVLSQAKGVEILVEGEDGSLTTNTSSASASVAPSPVPSPSPSRHTSPTGVSESPTDDLSSLTRNLSVKSLPEVDSTTRPSPPSRSESFRPFDSSGSNFSMRTAGANPNQASPGRNTGAPDLYGGGKSLWGKLSSNATAAFSAMQDTYASVAKELRQTGDDEPLGQPSELRSRDSLNAWGESRSLEAPPEASAAASPPSPLTGNPWATVKPAAERSIPGIFDNPWGVEGKESSVTDLPADPSVARPPPSRTSSTLQAPSISEASSPSESKDTPKVSDNGPTGTNSNTDPLGVGFS